MDRNLQKIILKIIATNRGVATWSIICNKASRNYWRDSAGKPAEEKTIIKHQLDLLEKEDKVIRKDQLPDIFYILTPEGHRVLDPWHKKIYYFVLYNKTNLYVLLSLVISVAALIVSFFGLYR